MTLHKKLAFGGIILLGITAFLLGRYSAKGGNENNSQFAALNAMSLPTLDLAGSNQHDLANGPKLKILSGTLMGLTSDQPARTSYTIFDRIIPGAQAQTPPISGIATSTPSIPTDSPTASSEATQAPQPTHDLPIVGLRIAGEYTNTGTAIAQDIEPIIRFYDRSKNLLSTKKAFPNNPYKFVPIRPDEVRSYDILVQDPPKEADSVQIEFKPKGVASDHTQYLFLNDVSLEPTQARSGEQEFTYYKFKGTLVNTGTDIAQNAFVAVWVKDVEGSVIAVGYKVLQYDILNPNQEFPLFFPIMPLKKAEMASYETSIWHE